MRKIIIVVLAALAVVGGGYGGWRAYKHFTHDALAAGEALYDQGDLHGAALELRNAVRNHPENARAHVLLARVQLRGGDAVAAEKELKQAQALHYPGPELLPMLSTAYLGQERFRDLLRDIPVGTLPPEQEALLLVSRSLAQTALGDLPSARASATGAQRLDPQLADAQLAEARILAVSGDRVQALLKLDAALKLDPKLLEALGLKSDVLREQGDIEQAVATLDRAVEIGPTLPRVRVARARLLILEGQDDKASADLDVALKGEPRSAIAHYLKALLLIRAKDWPAADLELQKIQPVLGQMPRGDYYYALVKANINQLEQADEEISHYVARSPQDPNGFRLLARIDILMNKQVDAQLALKRVTALGGTATDLPPGASAEVRAAVPAPESPEELTHIATQQVDQGNAAGAARDLEQSLESKPRPADTGATQVMSALAAADVGRAEAAYERIKHDANADPIAVANLGAMIRMSQLDFAGARAIWEDALKRWPNSVPMQMNLVRVLGLTDHAAEAEKLLAAILVAQPAQGAALRLMIETLAGRRQIAEALAYARAARQAAPNALPLLVTVAALQAQAGDFSAAYGTLDEVPLEQAQSPLLLNVRAQIQLAQGRVKDATDSFRQILLGNPADQGTRQRLIQLLAQAGQGEEALRLAREGLAQAPGNSSMMQLVVALVNSTQGMDAAQTEAATLRRDPLNLPGARLLKGALYSAAKRYDEAVAAYREELKTEPFDSLVDVTATTLAKAGHPDEAEALLRDWVTKVPDAQVSDTLAAVDISQHHYDQAAQNLEAVLAERPNDATALNNLAWIYQLRHDPKAHALAQRSYLLQPSPQSADTLGWILVQEGNTEVGLMLERGAARAMPADGSVLYHLATALKASGQRDNAVKLLTALLNAPVRFDERDDAVKLETDLGGPPVPAVAPAPAAAPAVDPPPAK